MDEVRGRTDAREPIPADIAGAATAEALLDGRVLPGQSWEGFRAELQAVFGALAGLAGLWMAFGRDSWRLGDAMPGQPIRSAFGALRCTADDDPDVLAALLRAARQQAGRQGQAFLLLGFDTHDPLLATLGRPLALPYESDVFLGAFGDDQGPKPLDGRPVHVEVGTL